MRSNTTVRRSELLDYVTKREFNEFAEEMRDERKATREYIEGLLEKGSI